MPDKPLNVATYAVGASLAAATLVYVFAPTFFIDAEAEGNANSRKRGVVGLVNPANDCFINSTVQALAGLGDLRLYLIREIHRRHLDGPSVYRNLVDDPLRPELPEWKIDGLQNGIVTKGLKELIDGLNERPLYKKTISIGPFVKCLEVAFRQRISRQQQDAQEFLQIVAERLCDEYHAGQRARKAAREAGKGVLDNAALTRELSRLTIEVATENEQEPNDRHQPTIGTEALDHSSIDIKDQERDIATATAPPPTQSPPSSSDPEDGEEGFPLEGTFESQIECLSCGYKPSPNVSTFCSLTLNVPALPTTTLNACFDGVFKTEYIDDFRCEKCRLVHALQVLDGVPDTPGRDDAYRATIARSEAAIEHAIENDPEAPLPPYVELAHAKFAPKRRIARHIRITSFPKILSLHLSRSIYGQGSSVKNAAKVVFPEALPLGGLLNQHKYKLQSVVTHKGSHHSGHYETFRRQNTPKPFANRNPFEPSEAFSRSNTPGTSIAPTPQLRAVRPNDGTVLKHDADLRCSKPRNPSISRVSMSDSVSPPSTAKSEHVSRSRTPSSASTSSGVSKDESTPTKKEGLRLRTRSSISKLSNNISRTLSKSPSKSSRSSSQSPTVTSPTLGTTTTVTTGLDTIATGTTWTATDADAEGALDKINLKKMHKRRQKQKMAERWWRISDEKVKESKTSEVLGMQREVYLLFYELQL